MTTIVELHANSQRFGYTMDVDLATLLIRLIKVRKERTTVGQALEMLRPLVPHAVGKVKKKQLADETMFFLTEGTARFYDFGPREAEDLT